jgi:hypothetical protein
VRFENKQSSADLNDPRGKEREALIFSLGFLGVSGRMTAG